MVKKFSTEDKKRPKNSLFQVEIHLGGRSFCSWWACDPKYVYWEDGGQPYDPGLYDGTWMRENLDLEGTDTACLKVRTASYIIWNKAKISPPALRS